MSFSLSGRVIIISTSEGTQPAMVVTLPELFDFPVARAETEVEELALENIAKWVPPAEDQLTGGLLGSMRSFQKPCIVR